MDYERYGDYSEYEDDAPKSRNKIVLLIKTLIYLVCFSVVGVLIFRVVLFNYYPDSIKNVYFSEALSEYYDHNTGEVSAKKQELRAPYDDPDVANFFCDNLIVIEDIGELQVSVRLNFSSAIENLKNRYSITELDENDKELFTFRLYDNNGNIYENPVYVGTDSFMMYRYYKLVFDGVVFGEDYPNWIRLEIFMKGQTDSEPCGMVPIYENNVDYSLFEDYIISDKELPS